MLTNRIKKQGILFVLSAPSGCGKTTLAKKLIKSGIGIDQSISMTTRSPREGEIEGKDYFFVTQACFKKIISDRGFLEWTKNFGFFYGTPKRNIINNIKKGKDTLLLIDVKGALLVKKLFREAVLIFLLPPSLADLKKRLKVRNSDTAGEIERRFKIAKKEISYVNRYDYKIINDNLKKAENDLKSIIIAERRKVCRM